MSLVHCGESVAECRRMSSDVDVGLKLIKHPVCLCRHCSIRSHCMLSFASNLLARLKLRSRLSRGYFGVRLSRVFLDRMSVREAKGASKSCDVLLSSAIGMPKRILRQLKADDRFLLFNGIPASSLASAMLLWPCFG